VRALLLAIVLAFGTLAPVYAQPREREVLRERPSGFWTSNKPAQGGAYRWRLLGLGVAIAGVMGLVMVRVLRSANGARGERR
jgi:hypothetical protein